MLSISSFHPSITAAAAANHHSQQCSAVFSPPTHLALPLRHRRINLRCGGSSESNEFVVHTSSSSSTRVCSDPLEVANRDVKLKIAIIGFGNFGQFLAKTIAQQGHRVLAYSRSDYSRAAKEIGVEYFSDADDLCEEHPEVILLCTSILSTEKVLRSFPLHRLRRSTLFADVLSVKEFPRSLFLQVLPKDFDILCTHPMFGPDSGKNGWGGLPFVFDKVRVGSDPTRTSRAEAFLDVFRNAGCRMVEMTCADHDKHAAGSQFITHMMGRVLEKLALENTPINTKGYESLLNLVDNTARDSFELFYGLFLYNKNAMEQLDRMDWAFEMVKKQLSGYLHDLVRKQLIKGKKKNYVFHGGVKTLTIRSIDAAQPYDYESKLAAINGNSSSPSSDYPKLKVAIVGFGNYGQFLAKTLVLQGHTVLAYSRSDYSKIASNLGVSYFSDPHDLCEEHPEVILLCTSILSTEYMLNSLPLQRLKRSTLFVDVLSVKEFPRNLFLQILPPDFDILCTHPMFGPESGKNGWGGLPFVYDKVRIGSSEGRIRRCENFLDVFRRAGCRVEEMTCAEHDKYAAGSQFITHFLGRVLEKLDLDDTPINTKGYESLLNLVDNTSKDSFELFYGLFLYNQNAMEQLERLDWAFELVKKQLFGHLHGLLRNQLFGCTELDERIGKAKELKLLSDAAAQNGIASSSTPRENANSEIN
ncbi:arogenate dehydrogenase 1, chloroplastic-like [Chenopodium quinoa]|uniref:arogenate dehydrogenase 1, chloroplastic-like n=1 Tax=Chenopodium quinoa TaxID=63459 RepID=UPI000B76C03D|nr:arogenate dehydrogenase 1, chloroplastic-like [Chenopodium quinoa]